jgi:hypothetical protein
MTTERKEEIYAAMVQEAEAYTARGKTLSRFEMLKIMDGWDIPLTRDSVDLVEKLHADGFVNE